MHSHVCMHTAIAITQAIQKKICRTWRVVDEAWLLSSRLRPPCIVPRGVFVVFYLKKNPGVFKKKRNSSKCQISVLIASCRPMSWQCPACGVLVRGAYSITQHERLYQRGECLRKKAVTTNNVIRTATVALTSLPTPCPRLIVRRFACNWFGIVFGIVFGICLAFVWHLVWRLFGILFGIWFGICLAFGTSVPALIFVH